jgi:hypothetical protein
MGYLIKSLTSKKSLPHWRLQFVSFKKADWPERTKAKMPRKEWNIVRDRWHSLGFSKFMTLAEAKARAKQLNALAHLKSQEERIKKIADEQFKTQRRYDAVLPIEFVEEFELRFVKRRDSQTENGTRKRSRAYTSWRSAQTMIAAIGVEPSEWFYHTNDIYDYFYNRKASVKYLNSICRMANLWGFFICKKLGRPFMPIPQPRGYERSRLLDANYEEKTGVHRASKALTPAQLQKVSGKINAKNFNWIFLTVWFGLRPKEVDNIQDRQYWRVEELPNGRKILWVFQTKLVALPPQDRWKPIPILFDEQHVALFILEGGVFKRPLIRTMRPHFDDGVNLYAGRKGFSDLMISKGQILENISVWMGHTSIQRTWRSYKDRKIFHVSGF